MIRKTFLASLLTSVTLGAATTFAGDTNKKAVAPAPEDNWEFKLSMPGWIPWMTGHTSLNGKTTHLDLTPSDIIPRWDMVADVRAEASKGRFSIMGELLYMSLSDGVGTNTIVKKLDLQMDQTMGDLGFAYRVIDSPRGYLDLTAGVRYTNLYQKLALQPDDERIDDLSGKLSTVASAVRVARIASALRTLEGRDPTVPTAPLAGNDPGRLARSISRLKGTTAERKEKIADLLHNALDRTVSRTDDWWDPYIGARGRYNLNDKFYLTAKGDIGGFGVGADLTWTAEAALGVQLSRNMFGELGYRAMGVDYRDSGFVLDTVTHGIQMNLGLTF